MTKTLHNLNTKVNYNALCYHKSFILRMVCMN